MNRRNFFTEIAGTFVAGVAIALGASRREGFKPIKLPKGWFIANYKFASKDYAGPVEFIVHRKGFSRHA